MNHYVYLLQNKNDGKKYIGVRSCKGIIEEDAYMSSSKWATKAYLAECTKTILKTFNTRKEAVQYEIYLHNKYDVAVNPEYFNQAKQTATKFDQSGKIFSSLNPNAKIINVYDHNGIYRMTFNGDLTNATGIPKNAFRLSFKQGGKPLGNSKQSRTELRKNMFQCFIGWYALEEGTTRTSTVQVDCDIESAQKIGLFCRIPIIPIKDDNPNAKCYIFKNNENKTVAISNGTFVETCKTLGIPRSMAFRFRDKGPITTKRIKYLHLNGWTITKKDGYVNNTRTIKSIIL